MRPQVMVTVVLLLCATAHAADVDDARLENEKAKASFALGDFAGAAQHYEKAFQFHADAALLYNAAQSHRLAGNKQRALLLYENLERLYPEVLKGKREEIDRHIADLRAAIASDSKSKGPPQTVEPLPRDGDKTPPNGNPSPNTQMQPAPEAVVAKSPPENKPLVKKPWFWVVVGGGVVVVALAVGLGVGLSSPGNPTPTLGGLTVH